MPHIATSQGCSGGQKILPLGPGSIWLGNDNVRCKWFNEVEALSPTVPGPSCTLPVRSSVSVQITNCEPPVGPVGFDFTSFLTSWQPGLSAPCRIVGQVKYSLKILTPDRPGCLAADPDPDRALGKMSLQAYPPENTTPLRDFVAKNYVLDSLRPKIWILAFS